MAREVSNGNHCSASKPPPTPSPLRFSKFFQSNMRILVTGGAGFIGSHLVDKLMENEKKEVLAINAAKDATELVAKLRAYHHAAQTKFDKKHLSSMGLDPAKGTIRNNLEAGVIEPAMSKAEVIVRLEDCIAATSLVKSLVVGIFPLMFESFVW